MSREVLVLIFGPLIIIKLARLATTVVLVVRYLRKATELPSLDPINFFIIIKTMREPISRWSLQIADNA